MMKRKWILGSALAVLLLAGCSEDTDKSPEEKTRTEESADKTSAGNKVLDPEDFDKMYSNPKSYKGYEVTYTGKVLQMPEVDEDGVYLQVYAKPEDYEQNTIVFYPDTSFKAAENDYVRITGNIYDEFTGENMLGGEVTAPMIKAEKVEKVSYIDAVAPTVETLELNEVKEQHGYKLTLEKIELADTQTRVYFTVANTSKHKISFYDFNSKIIANGKQLENEHIYESDLEELQSEILPETSTSGVIIFPALEEGTESIQIYAEGSSENYEISIDPFTFDVKL